MTESAPDGPPSRQHRVEGEQEQGGSTRPGERVDRHERTHSTVLHRAGGWPTAYAQVITVATAGDRAMAVIDPTATAKTSTSTSTTGKAGLGSRVPLAASAPSTRLEPHPTSPAAGPSPTSTTPSESLPPAQRSPSASTAPTTRSSPRPAESGPSSASAPTTSHRRNEPLDKKMGTPPVRPADGSVFQPRHMPRLRPGGEMGTSPGRYSEDT